MVDDIVSVSTLEAQVHGHGIIKKVPLRISEEKRIKNFSTSQKFLYCLF
jgi:hypothetical protein